MIYNPGDIVLRENIDGRGSIEVFVVLKETERNLKDYSVYCLFDNTPGDVNYAGKVVIVQFFSSYSAPEYTTRVIG